MELLLHLFSYSFSRLCFHQSWWFLDHLFMIMNLPSRDPILFDTWRTTMESITLQTSIIGPWVPVFSLFFHFIQRREVKCTLLLLFLFGFLMMFQSVAFTGVHGYAIAGVWTLCGVCLGIFLIFKNISSRESSSSFSDHLDRYCLLLFMLFLLLTLLAM